MAWVLEGDSIVALSKARRFEIFKRDSFTCQYCGQHPPEVTLQVDHVEPRALGGSDDELNLVTSCVDCNAGKHARRLTDVRPRPDAELAYLEVQQEIEETRHYRAALAEREAETDRLVESLQDMWCGLTHIYLFTPDSVILRQFLNRYSPEVVEAALRDVAPKVDSGYVEPDGRAWIRYAWTVMRNMAED